MSEPIMVTMSTTDSALPTVMPQRCMHSSVRMQLMAAAPLGPCLPSVRVGVQPAGARSVCAALQPERAALRFTRLN